MGRRNAIRPLGVPCRGGRKAWRPRGWVVAGFSGYASLRGAGRARGKTSKENVCFPVWRETAVLKWYVALGEACFSPFLSPLEELR